MEHSHSKKRKKVISPAVMILRDTLIFLFCVLAMVLFTVFSRRAKSSETVQTDQLADASVSASAEVSNALVQNADTPAVPGATAVPESTELATVESQQTTDPQTEVESETDVASANGDFSATFPTSDTGIGALFSYQDENKRIAINKVQADGVTYFVADVWVKQIDAFRTAFAEDSYGRGIHEMPLTIAENNGAVFAISGDYYGAREEGVVVRNGQLYRDVMSDDVCVLSRDGTLAVYQKGAFSSLDDLNETIWQAWAFGPALVENGQVCDTSSSKIKVKNPRCAIGYYAPGHYCFIVVDGRQAGYSDGMTLDELANTFATLGCQTAYNLDGGATAMMVFDGAVISQPTSGGRESSDIIFF